MGAGQAKSNSSQFNKMRKNENNMRKKEIENELLVHYGNAGNANETWTQERKNIWKNIREKVIVEERKYRTIRMKREKIRMNNGRNRKPQPQPQGGNALKNYQSNFGKGKNAHF